MDAELYCLFCSSEMDYDIEDKYAECMAMNCGAYFHLEVEGGLIIGCKVARQPKECL